MSCSRRPTGTSVYVKSVVAVRRFLREWEPDVVNTHSSRDAWLVALARLRLVPCPRIVRTRHLSAAGFSSTVEESRTGTVLLVHIAATPDLREDPALSPPT